MSRRCLALAVCFVLLVSPLLSVGNAAAATGPGGPRSTGNGSGAASAVWADLPAMALTPDDLPDKPYGASTSWLLDLHAFAAYKQSAAAATKTERDFADYGFLISWRSRLAQPVDVDGKTVNRRQVGQQFTQFATPAGAHKGFAAITASATIGGDVELTTPALGDESRVITRVTSASQTLNHLNLVIRTGQFVVEIDIAAVDSEPAPALDAAALAAVQTLLDRVQEVAARTDLGLSQRALRLAVVYGSGAKAYARYDRLNGRTLATYDNAYNNVDPDATKVKGAAPNIFYVFQYANGGNQGASYEGRVMRFASEADAEAWVDRQDFSRYANAAELTPSETIGDQTIAASYDFPDVEDGAPHTLSVIVRVGDTIAWIAVNHGEAPTLENVEALAKLHSACLTADSPCAPISPDLIANAAS